MLPLERTQPLESLAGQAQGSVCNDRGRDRRAGPEAWLRAPQLPAGTVTGYYGWCQGQIFAGATLGARGWEGALVIRPEVPELPRAQRLELESQAQAGLAH